MGTIIGTLILGSIIAFLTVGASTLEKDLEKLHKHKH